MVTFLEVVPDSNCPVEGVWISGARKSSGKN